MVGQIQSTIIQKSVPPVEPDALQVVGLQHPPDQAVGLVHNTSNKAMAPHNLKKERGLNRVKSNTRPTNEALATHNLK